MEFARFLSPVSTCFNRIREENGPDGFTTYTYDDQGNRLTMESNVRPNFVWISQDFMYNVLTQPKSCTHEPKRRYSYYPDVSAPSRR